MHAYLDQVVAELASRQYGIVTRRQLTRADLSRDAIDGRVAGGRLFRVHRGVYAVGHEAPRREARWLAAVLACGPGAVLSHRSAATLWRFRDGELLLPDVTVPGRGGRGHDAIAIHRCALTPADYAVVAGIPVTSPARTLGDLARVADSDDDAERAVREAMFLGKFDPAAVRELLERRPNRALAAAIADHVPTRSKLEDAMWRVVRRHQLPRPQAQSWVGARRLDFVWHAERLVVETDGWEGHRTPAAFQRDRTTSNQLQLGGYLVLRFTHADLERRPARVAEQIRAALAARGGHR